MKSLMKCAVLALALGGAATGVASASEILGVHVGGVGLGFTVGNGHYYRHHHRRDYSYPSDWRSYHHSQVWYRSHPHWNDRNDHDWYRN